MQNFLLQTYCIKLSDEIVKFLSQKEKNCNAAIFQNNININKIQIVNLEMACQKYALPCVTFNQVLQVMTSNFENTGYESSDKFDVVLSFFNLHTMSKEEQIQCIQKMHKLAPKALFLEYENPERNLAYLGYFPFMFTQYAVCFLDTLFTANKNSLLYLQEYLNNGAVEGIIYALPQILQGTSIRMLARRHLGLGAVGMAYLEW